MKTMTILHELDGRCFTVQASRRPRRLFVLEGRAWITQQLPEPAWRRFLPAFSAAGPVQPLPDWWLAAGATLELPAGSGWIVQAEGTLRLALSDAAPAPARRGRLSGLRTALAGWRPAGPWTSASASAPGPGRLLPR